MIGAKRNEEEMPDTGTLPVAFMPITAGTSRAPFDPFPSPPPPSAIAYYQGHPARPRTAARCGRRRSQDTRHAFCRSPDTGDVL